MNENVEPIRPEEESNIEGLHEAIKEAAESIIADKIERGAISARINKTKSGLVAKGIPKSALNRAIADLETSRTEGGKETVKAETEAYWIARDALGLPGNPDMFED